MQPSDHNLSSDIDAECIELCTAINLFSPDIYTTESCCGHGEGPYHIWFGVGDHERLPGLLYWFDSCHCGYRGWSVVVYTDCAMSSVTYKLTGPVGEPAYEQAGHIASLIRKYVEELNDETK